MYYCIVLCIVIADQLTKMWVSENFSLYDSLEVIPGFFNLVYVTNPGAAFSMFADITSPWRHYFFLAIGGVAIVGITAYNWLLREKSRYSGVALALIAGGAAGNLVDRIRFGVVIDFLDFYWGGYHWPAFNVADSAICVGAGLFLLINILESKKLEEGR